MALQSPSIRDVLRRETRAEHEATDEAYSKLDLASRRGLTAYLQAHRLALSVAEPVIAAHPCGQDFPARVHLVDGDLLALGALPPAPKSLGLPSHALGAAYVVAGSSLGSQVLRQRWAASPDPSVQSAGSLFGDARMLAFWKGFQPTLAASWDEAEDRDAVLLGARETFILFREALEGLIPPTLR